MTWTGPPITRRRAIGFALWLGTLFLGVHLLLPQLAGLEATARQLIHARWWLPVTAVLLEAASLASYAELERVLLRADGQRAPRSLLVRSTVVGTALGKTLPGGSTTAFALIVRFLKANGLDATKVTTALAAAGTLSAAVLALLLPVGALLALAGGQGGGVALGAVFAAVTVLAVAALLPFVLRDPERAGLLAERTVRWFARGPLRNRLHPAGARRSVTDGIRSAQRLTRSRAVLAQSVGWAAANWLLDVAVLALLADTIGSGTPLWGILLAYVVGTLANTIPLTPGGVGVVETAMVGALVAGGAPAPAATAAVLGWRLVSHWLVIVVGVTLLPTVSGSRRAA